MALGLVTVGQVNYQINMKTGITGAGTSEFSNLKTGTLETGITVVFLDSDS
jgi:hypothetical protein